MSASSLQPGRARRLVLSILLLAAGLALLAWTVGRLELTTDDIQNGFSKIGAWFGAILLLSLVRFGLRARAWVALTGLPLPLGPAVAATISGDALGNVTPLGLVASEPSKAIYLRRHADPGHTLPALVAENFFYSVSVAIYVIVAAAAMFVFFDLEPDVRVAGQLSLAGMAVVLAGAAWLGWRKPTMVSAMVAKLPGRRLRVLAGRVEQFEHRAYGAAASSGRPLGTVATCEIGFHLLSLAECWLTFWLLAGETSFVPALVFDGFNRVVNVLFKHLPLRLGVEESGTALLASAIGLAAADGFMLAIVRKVRMIVWAAIGLVLWARRTSATDTGSSSRTSRSS
jgi:hypothetical protein